MMITDTYRPFLGPDLREWGSIAPNERGALRAALAGRLPPKLINALMRRSGFRTPEALRHAEDSELLAVDNVGVASLALIRTYYPKSEMGPTERANGRLDGTCAACETPYSLGVGHGLHDCIRALLLRIKDLESR